MTPPKNAKGEYILDSLPRDMDNIDIDVYYFNKITNEHWVEESEYGHVERGDDGHYYFHDYWWSEGNMSCDCNRGWDDCNVGLNRTIIEKITPHGMPDVILMEEK